ncbi:hypothetical protein DCC39_17355 [Pueribacillus theae]|uniref:Regulatory protein YycH-like domain-containing protein n=1 Tax=Pueribacillus theae TaxID=2171751 RepID=A0A2U1JN87_9BACI|nr:two-component system regulatory protein YycI [Pueribacillus theae]PWA06627.1 hypothetical protein DCC39_17355 [Pueribacillus theae]
MDWSRTKTIFIITFLVLDLFLGFQLYQKQTENQFDYISESFLKIEDKLQSMNIRYRELPEVPKKLVHIIGQTHTFTNEEISKLKKDGVTIERTDGDKKLRVTYDEPQSLNVEGGDLANILPPYTLFSEDYIYSDYLTSEGKELVFVQTYDDRWIYQKEGNANGQITVQLDKDGKMISFVQTYLDTNEQGEEQEILTAIKAIDQLLINNKLKNDDKISFIELGYYSLVEGDVQVLAPTWLIEVNKERHYYVNAVNGLIDDPNRDPLPKDAGEDTT